MNNKGDLGFTFPRLVIVGLLFIGVLVFTRPVQSQPYSSQADGWVCYVPKGLLKAWGGAMIVDNEFVFYPKGRYYLSSVHGMTTITEKRPGVFLAVVIKRFVGIPCVEQGTGND